MRDIRSIKKQKHFPEAAVKLPQLYKLVRYEDYISQTVTEIEQVFDFLQVSSISLGR